MTIKGPYIVTGNDMPQPTSAGMTDTEIQRRVKAIYNNETTRQYITEDGGTDSYYIVWFTDCGRDVHSGWNIHSHETNYPIAKYNAPGASEADYYGTYSSSSGFLNATLFTYDDIGKYMWSFSLGSTDTGYPHLKTTTADQSNSGTWNFSERKFDFSRLEITITPYATDYAEYQEAGILEIEAHPEWTIKSARYLDASTLEIHATSKFGRTDDRWALESASYVVNNELSLLRSGEPWGMIEGIVLNSSPYDHVIYVDTHDLARVVSGREVYFSMHFNHIWNAANDNTVHAAGTVQVESSNKCAMPNLTGEFDDSSVILRVKSYTQTGSGAATPQYIIAAMDGAKFRDDIQVEEVSNQTAIFTFPYPPLGEYVTFEAVGLYEENGTYYTSTVSTYSLGIESHGRTIINSVTTGEKCELTYHSSGSDKGPSIKVDSDSVQEQLSGRSRPSVFYGGSGTTDISFNGLLLDNATDFEALPDSGFCVIRFPDGRRYAADIKVDISENREHLTSVSISGTEVDF